MRMQSWKLGLRSTTPAAIINKGHMLEMDRKPMALWFHTLSSSAFTTHILQHLFICFCYWEVQWLKWAEASTFIEFGAVNDLDMMLAKSTLCADNNNLLIIFTFIYFLFFIFIFASEQWKSSKSRNLHDNPSKFTWIGSNSRSNTNSPSQLRLSCLWNQIFLC